MLDRIERVTRVKGVELDVGRSFKRKDGYDDDQKEKKQEFEQVLNMEMSKEIRPSNDAGPNAPKAYRLELVRPTHSLYYENRVDIGAVRQHILHKYG